MVIKIFNKVNIKRTFALLLSIIIIILAIYMIGAVSASETTISNTTTGGIKAVIGTASPNDKVILNNGIYSGVNNREIDIAKNLTIIGKSKGNAIIDGQNVGRIFNINENVTVTLLNLTIRNGYVTNYGGAIFNKGNGLTITNCTFTNNRVNGGSGGAIYNYYGEGLTITNCVFSNNKALSGSGGAIYSIGTMSIIGSTFTNNQGKFSGGAVYNSGKLVVSSCNFNNNQADVGGAIDNNVVGSLSVISSTFSNNLAINGKGGGAIYTSSKLTVDSCTFTNNQAKNGSGGGAICNLASNFVVTNSRFINNIQRYVYKAIYSEKPFTQTNVFFSPKENTEILSGKNNTPNQNNVPVKKADLKIYKIYKKGKYHYVFIKNIGKKTAGQNLLGIYFGKKLIKKVKINSIGVNKYKKVKVYIIKKYRNKIKTFKVDIKNKIKENNKKNNIFKSR